MVQAILFEPVNQRCHTHNLSNSTANHISINQHHDLSANILFFIRVIRG